MATNLPASLISNEERCTMCLEILITKAEVRRLPCKHLVCMSCLRERKRTKTGIIKCTVHTCGTDHGAINPDILAVVFFQYACETDNCDLPADAFCTSCLHLMCKNHREAHDGLLSKHKTTVISLDDYKLDEQKLAPRVCRVEGHETEIVRMACTRCRKPFCPRCVTTSTTCDENSQGLHNVKLAEELTGMFGGKYKDIAEKLIDFESAMLDVTKKTNTEYDNYKQHYEELQTQILRKSQDMISKIENTVTRYRNLLSTLISQYYQQTDSVAEKASTERNRAIDGHVTLNNLSSRNVLDTIQQPEVIERVEGICDTPIPNIPKKERLMVINLDSALMIQQDFKFVVTPEHELTFNRTMPSPNSGGNICSGGHVNGELVTGSTKLLGLGEQFQFPLHIWSMAMDEQNPSHMYILSQNIHGDYSVKEFKISRLNVVSHDLVELSVYQTSGVNALRHLTVVKDFIIVTDYPNSLKVFNRSGSHQYDINFQKSGKYPCGIDHLPDDSIVVSFYNVGEIINLTTTREPDILWRVETIQCPTAVCVNRRSELILVAQYTAGKISMLTYKGNLLTTLLIPSTNPSGQIYDMSVYDDEIAIVSRLPNPKLTVYNLKPRTINEITQD